MVGHIFEFLIQVNKFFHSFVFLAIKPLNKFNSPSSSAAGTNSDLLASLDNFDYEEQLVVLYNRVPKTGSTSFVNIAYDLCKKNRFHVLHINITANNHVLTLPNQVCSLKPTDIEYL